MLSINIHEHNRENHHLPNLLVFPANCPDSLTRNKAKNALSLAKTISPVLAEAKIQRFSFVTEKWQKKTYKRKKKSFFSKKFPNLGTFCYFCSQINIKPTIMLNNVIHYYPR